MHTALSHLSDTCYDFLNCWLMAALAFLAEGQSLYFIKILEFAMFAKKKLCLKVEEIYC